MTEAKTVQRGDQVPHFEVRTLEGKLFTYTTIWQHRNLVLVTLPEAPCGAYASALAARAAEFEAHGCACVITRDRVPGVPAPGALVADRWGEIVHVAASRLSGLPTPAELLEWVDYVARRCPECEGEAK